MAKDNTPAQAKRWVEQELAKSLKDPQQRLDAERSFQKMYAAMPGLPNLPNSQWAHAELIRRLEALV